VRAGKDLGAGSGWRGVFRGVGGSAGQWVLASGSGPTMAGLAEAVFSAGDGDGRRGGKGGAAVGCMARLLVLEREDDLRKFLGDALEGPCVDGGVGVDHGELAADRSSAATNRSSSSRLAVQAEPCTQTAPTRLGLLLTVFTVQLPPGRSWES
jgi:hypothetical protein